ncbi:MAG: phosphoadenosine phosphosulfate reductase family protein [Oscillospiraceae bacterium]|nr:phosphoadenosine phosphosulfate reductase family protein [Oscillospiraceae bacterium]
MYSYNWDVETGGLLLNSSPLSFSKEPRPVYYKELDILGFDKYWKYTKDDSYPYMWAEANNYYYRGKRIAQTKGGSLYTAPELILLEDPGESDGSLHFVDVPAMVEKNRDMIEKLASDTIKKIYNTYMEYKSKVDVFYVAFSGGKDSIVTLDLVQRALPHNMFKVLFGDTGMEFPDTYKVVDQVENNCKEANIEFLRSKSDFDPEYTWQQFGPPAQRMRWCCSVHKSAPQIIKLRQYLNNSHFCGMAFTGIRGDESVSRSEYSDVSLGEKIKGQYSCHPILEWNSAELFLYIYSRNLPVNDAYKKGNSRAGCLVCPLAALKNMYFKEQSYSKDDNGYKTTTTFNDIILKTSSKEFNDQNAAKEFMDSGGWKARRSGRELSIAKSYVSETFDKGMLEIKVSQKRTEWKQWIKTIGNVSFLENGGVDICYRNKVYRVNIKETSNELVATCFIETNTQNDIYFISSLKIVFRKVAYCIGCRVCEANCPNGFITMKNGNVYIDDRCTKCGKCREVSYGCLVADSMRLPKGEKKMGSIDRYGNMGVEYTWVVDYFKLKNDFWSSPHSLGSNKIKYLKSFLNDSEITQKNSFADFGKIVDKIGIETAEAWALILCNLAYTSEFNWWIKNIELSVTYTPDSIHSMLDDTMSDNSRSHIVSAYKNIFISNHHLGAEIGLGSCDYELKNGKRILNSITRYPWKSPNSKVILYSLYKFAEACDGYYQFSLTRLLDYDIDSDGVSPTQIFGIERDTMEKILNGLSINYPEFISTGFTLDLDMITLNDEKTSKDVLTLF